MTHARDHRITFDEETHTYTIDGSCVGWTSATTFIKTFFEPFNADRILGAMVRRGTFSAKYGDDKTPADVKAMWSALGAESARLGTKLHAMIELFYNGQPPESVDAEIETEWNLFLEFDQWMKDTHPDWVPHKTEWRVFDEDVRIAGSIDMIFKNTKTGALAIYDWKRSKEIQMSNLYKKYGKPPIRHLDDCNFIHYSLQLNLYKYILETKYGETIDHMALVVLHPNNEQFIVYAVHDLGTDIDAMCCTRLTKNDDVRQTT